MPARSAPQHSIDPARSHTPLVLRERGQLRRLLHIPGGGSCTIQAVRLDRLNPGLQELCAPRAGGAGDTTAAFGFLYTQDAAP